MGHLINPVTYRLGKTKFWNFAWVNKTKKNYKNFLIEDLNFYKFSKWLFSILSWEKIGVFIYDFKLIKKFDSIDFCLFFFLRKLRLSVLHKKSFFHFFVKNSFLNFFFKTSLNKKMRSFKSFFLLKNNSDLLKNKSVSSYKKLKRKKYFFKKKRILKMFLKQQYSSSLKKKKKNKKKLWLNNFLFNYSVFLFNKDKMFKKMFFKKFNYYFLNQNLNKSCYLFKDFLKNDDFFLLQKNFLNRSFNYNFFFSILKIFLTFFLKKVFGHSKVNFNFFQKKLNFLNSNSIKKYIRFNMLNNRSRVTQVVKKVFKKTKKKYFILGLKIGFFGRYEKKLRNKSVWQIRGSLSPSNINTPITHKNFCILLKQGLCGVKVSFLNKLKKNEIFEKKTFVN